MHKKAEKLRIVSPNPPEKRAFGNIGRKVPLRTGRKNGRFNPDNLHILAVDTIL